MIYTLTLNPSVDYKIVLKEFQEESLNYALNNNFFAGGKGINVSTVLKNLGKSSTALGFLGGFTGDYIKSSLDSKGIKNDFIKIKYDTRLNIKMIANGRETEINANSPDISENEFNLLKDKLKSLTNNSILVMSGSVPAALGENAYNEISNAISNDVKLIIDTSGKPLKKILRLNPFLIKPNIYELEDLFNAKLNSTKELIKIGKNIVESGVQNIIISMGSDGAIFIGSENVAFRAFVPKISSASTIGAGDSVIAGFVYAFDNRNTLKDSFKFGVAAGTATALKGNLCEFQDVKKMLCEIRVEDVCIS
ncbi:1-phosphofructokinase [Borreliella garinii]|uniref:1-phosphofructokinase n=1 Tax=Borreliella garinii TaxID=29519 RepID=UPI000410BC01|nr:1-phosphofructokinase [Borreliella garinii]APQ14959.1 1-phosphofructokinase [Borreliella garinii]AZA28033.1 1-phosphofructokinase [Borreliella garinii]